MARAQLVGHRVGQVRHLLIISKCSRGPRSAALRPATGRGLIHPSSGPAVLGSAPDNHGMWLRKRHIAVRIWVSGGGTAPRRGRGRPGAAVEPEPAPAPRPRRRPPPARRARPGAQPRRRWPPPCSRPPGVPLSQVTAVNVCGAPQPGHAACAAQKLVLRSSHRLVHPHVTPHPTFTQVFPRHRSGARARRRSAGLDVLQPGERPRGGHARLPPAGLRPHLPVADRRGLGHGGDRRRLRRPQRPGRPGHLPQHLRPAAVHDRQRLLHQGQPERRARRRCPAPRARTGRRRSHWTSTRSRRCAPTATSCSSRPTARRPPTWTPASPRPSASAPTRSPTAGRARPACRSAWAASRARRSSPPPAITAIPAPASTTTRPPSPASPPPAARRSPAAAGGTSTRGYTESAWSLNSSGVGWGGGSGCDIHEPKPAYQADTGCTGRSYADVSADANPDTGLRVYDTGNGGWFVEGGTSLATPLIAAFEALTGVNGATAQWAYTDSALLNDPVSGLDRELRRGHRLHLQRRHRLRRADGHRLDLGRDRLRRPRHRRPGDRRRHHQQLRPDGRVEHRDARRRRLPQRPGHHLLLAVRDLDRLRPADHPAGRRLGHRARSPPRRASPA